MADYKTPYPLGVRGASPRGKFETFSSAIPARHLPDLVSYTYGMPPVYDQGEESDCVANGTAAGLSFFWNKRDAKWYDFSRAAIYSQGKLLYEGGDFSTPGMFPASALELVRDKGPVLESDVPSIPRNVESTAPLADNLFHPELRIKTFVEVDTDADSVMQAFHGAGPVLMAVDWPNSWFDPNPDGTLPAPDYSAGGHFVLGTAYDKDRQAVKIRNSWGGAWGVDEGYAWLPFRYLSTQGMNYYSIRVEAPAA